MGTRKLGALAGVALLLVAGAACGDDSGDDEPTQAQAPEDDRPESTPIDPEDLVHACDHDEDGEVVANILQPEEVASVFQGTGATLSSNGDDCIYEVSDGLVEVVGLVDPGPASDEWLNFKTILEQSGEELTDVQGLGDEAYIFAANPREQVVVVRTGTTMFRAGFNGDESSEVQAAIEAFSQVVVDYLEDLEDEGEPSEPESEGA